MGGIKIRIAKPFEYNLKVIDGKDELIKFKAGEEINDEVLETFAVVAAPNDLGEAVATRYAGLAQRVIPYTPYLPGMNDPFWGGLIKEIKSR